ncbi:MAG: hypothetical protein IKK04_10925 [Bacteroidales bacterium]|nr:hypothetical protein [Bacteroidales bacterium]
MKKALLLVLLVLSALSALRAQEAVINRDDDGHLASSSHKVMDADDHLAVLITYTYDSLGVVSTRMLQSYDRQGRPERKEIYTADEYLLYTEVNRYDCHGNRTRCIQTTYDEDGKPTETVYKYRYSKQLDGSYQLVSILLNGKEVLALFEE